MAHCKPLFIESNILTVINLYILNSLVNVQKHENIVVLRKDVHHHNTRNQGQIDLPQHRLQINWKQSLYWV